MRSVMPIGDCLPHSVLYYKAANYTKGVQPLNLVLNRVQRTDVSQPREHSTRCRNISSSCVDNFSSPFTDMQEWKQVTHSDIPMTVSE